MARRRYHTDTLRRFAMVAAWVLVAVSLLSQSARAKDMLRIEHQRMSAHISAAPMVSVIARLRSEFGIRIYVRGPLETRQVSASFDNEPLGQAMRRLFAPLGVVFVQRDDGTHTLFLLPEGQQMPAGASALEPPPQLPPLVAAAIREQEQTAQRGEHLDQARELLRELTAQADREGRSLADLLHEKLRGGSVATQ